MPSYLPQGQQVKAAMWKVKEEHEGNAAMLTRRKHKANESSCDKISDNVGDTGESRSSKRTRVHGRNRE